MVELKGINLGLCMCGSFCTYKKSFEAIERLKKIGVNINQLTKHINSLPLDEEIINSLSSIENFIAELKQIIDKLK